jgi:hypothetical protein
MINLGDFLLGQTVRLPWSTNAASGASITRGTDGAIRIYKDASTTQRASTSGITDLEDFDGVTGPHLVTIDTSDDDDPGFYAAGHDYHVMLVGAEIDGETVNVWLGTFSIENRSVARLLTAARPEPTVAPPEDASALAKLDWVGALARNTVEQDDFEQRLKDDAGTGTIATSPVSDDGTTFIRGKWA